MNKLRRISVIFMSLIMLFAMTISVSAATKVQDGIEVTLNTNLQSYDKGEEIVTAITVKNTNSYAVTDVDISCVAPAGYALTDSVGASTIPVLGANETVTLTVNLTPISSTATGDNSNMGLWGVLLVLALAGAVTLGIVYRKRWKGMLCLILCLAMLMTLLPVNMMQVSATDTSGIETQSTEYAQFTNNRIMVEAEDCINSKSDMYFIVDATTISSCPGTLWIGSKDLGNKQDVDAVIAGTVSAYDTGITLKGIVEGASGNKAVRATNAEGTLQTVVENIPSEPGLSYTFNAPEDGEYYVWVRGLSQENNMGHFWFKMDSGTYTNQKGLDDAGGSGTYKWIKVYTGELTAGEHTINISARKAYPYIDKLLISNSKDVDPNKDDEGSATPTAEPTATPTATPTAEPTATPTAEPTATPTAEPTATPTAEPTATPTTTPTAFPEFKNNRITVEAEDCINSKSDMYFVANEITISDYPGTLWIGSKALGNVQDAAAVIAGTVSAYDTGITLKGIVEGASGNAAVRATNAEGTLQSAVGNIPSEPGLSYTFNAPEDGEYYVWVRGLSQEKNMGHFWFKMDNGTYTQQKGLDDADGSGTYKWIKVYTGELTAGEHTINISARKAYPYIDKLLISNDKELIPKGDGEIMELTVEAEDWITDPLVYEKIAYEGASEGLVAKCISGKGYKETDNNNVYPTTEKNPPAISYTFNAPSEGYYDILLNVVEVANSEGDYGSNNIWYALNDATTYTQCNIAADAEDRDNLLWVKLTTLQVTEPGEYTINLFPRGGLLFIDQIRISEDVEADVEEELIYSMPEVSPTVGVHPRLWFTEKDIPTIVDNLDHEENSAMYAEFQRYLSVDYVDGKLKDSSNVNYEDYPLNIAKCCAFQYAITKDTDRENAEVYGKRAITIIENFLDTVVFTKTTDAHSSGETIYSAACVYDWCHDLLTEDQKDYIIDKCLKLATSYTEVGWPPVKNQSWGSHGSEDQLIKDLLAFGIAVYDEKPYVYNTVVGRLQDEYRSPRRDLYFNAHKSLFGTNYGPFRINPDVCALLMLSKIYPENSPNKNFWQNDEVHYVPYYYVYATRPDSWYLEAGDSNQYNIANPKVLTANKQANTMYAMLGSYYQDGYLKYMFLEECEDLMPAQCFLEILIVNDPTIEPISKENLPLSKYFDYPAGQYIARTGWDMGKDSDDVVVSMTVNEVTIKDHNHLDAGEFEIYYKGALATDSGYYQSVTTGEANNVFGSDYWHNYYHQTIAHNCMLVLDPNEPTINFIHNSAWFDIENTGGQISVSKQETVKYPEDAINFEENEDFNTCTVLGHEVDPYDELKPDYTYLKGDLAGAYSEKVANYERSFMFLNLGTTDEDTEVPAVLVVFDHVVSSNAAFKKTYLLHGINAPEIDGTRTVLKRTENGYNGKLVNDTLLPKADNVTITQVGSNPNEYIVGNKTFVTYTTAVGTDEGGGIRTEISPITASTEDYFLNVMQMSDADSTAEPLVATLIEADTHTGVVIADRVVMFGKTNERVAETITFSFGEEESTLSASVESSESLEASSASSPKGILSWFDDLFLVVKASDNIGVNKISVSETVTVAGKQVKVEGVVTYNLPGDNEEAEDEDVEEAVPEVTAAPEASASPEATATPEASETPEISVTPSPEPEVEETLYQITVADLKAGTWSYTNEDGSATGTVVVTEDGGVAAFEGPKGTYTLAYVNESTDGDITQPVYEKEEVPIKVRFNNYYLFSEKDLFMENDEVMIPMDVILGALGTTVEWNEETKTVTASRYDRTVAITADSENAIVNGEARALSVKARMVDDTLFVPLTFVTEAFLARVEWIAYSKTAIITDNVKPAEEEYIDIAYCWWDSGVLGQSTADGYSSLDRDFTTGWGSLAAEPGAKYVAYDFGEVKDVSTIELLWSRPHQRWFTFDVLISNDGENWTPVYEKIDSELVTADKQFEYQAVDMPEGTQARYIKLVCYGNTRPDGTGTYATTLYEIRFK